MEEVAPGIFSPIKEPPPEVGPQKAPGVGLLLAGVFVAEKLRKRGSVSKPKPESVEAEAPQPKPAANTKSDASPKRKPGSRTMSKREEVEENQAYTWTKLTPQARKEVLDASGGGLTVDSTYAKRVETPTTSRR